MHHYRIHAVLLILISVICQTQSFSSLKGRHTKNAYFSSKVVDTDELQAPSSDHCILQVTERSEIPELAALCISTFFDDNDDARENTPEWRPVQALNVLRMIQSWKKEKMRHASLQRLYDLQVRELSSRFPLLQNAMYYVKNGEGRAIAFAEITLWPFKMSYLSGESDEAEVTAPKIINVCVEKGERGKKHGENLMKACMAKVSEWNETSVFLLVDEDNTRARNFYKKLGFVELFRDTTMGTYDPGDGSQALRVIKTVKILMRKDVTP